MRIDIFCHVIPKPFFDRMNTISEKGSNMQKRVRGIPCLTDMDLRFRIMDEFGDYSQVIGLASPPIEALGELSQTRELARIVNDSMAELAAKHRDRFPGFVASIPMNNPSAAVEEIDRAVNQLGATGAQIFTNVNGKPLDDMAYLPIFEKMAKIDLPLWLHPTRGASFPDYLKREEIEVRAVVGIRLAI